VKIFRSAPSQATPERRDFRWTPPYQGVGKERDSAVCQCLTFDGVFGRCARYGITQSVFHHHLRRPHRDKRHGQLIPTNLGLLHFEVAAGKSTTETLLGRCARDLPNRFTCRARWSTDWAGAIGADAGGNENARAIVFVRGVGMTTRTKWPADFLALLAKVTNRRAKIVIEHILEHGSITTEIWKRPTATAIHACVRDVREYVSRSYREDEKHGGRASRSIGLGIPPTSEKAGSAGGKRSQRHSNWKSGRSTKMRYLRYALRTALICKIDHRVPYEIGGDAPDTHTATGLHALVHLMPAREIMVLRALPELDIRSPSRDLSPMLLG